MDENNFWLRFWGILAAGAVCIVVTAIVCSVVAGFDRRRAIVEMTKQGVNPVAASCAVYGSEDRPFTCMAAGVQK